MSTLYELIKKIGIWAISVLMVTSCGITKPVVVRDSTQINIHYVDSVNYIDSTIYHHIWKEHYKDYANLLDTLNLETSYSRAKAYIDTLNKKLKGEIENKEDSIPERIKWKTKTVYKDSTVYIKEEIPVPYEVEKKYVPKFYKWLLGINIALLLAGILYILKKFTKIFG